MDFKQSLTPYYRGCEKSEYYRTDKISQIYDYYETTQRV